jgi:phage gpG-like protein
MGSDPLTTWRNNQRAQESLRKLDGMLIQHMEDEKDTIKRIATTMKQTADSQFSNLPDC